MTAVRFGLRCPPCAPATQVAAFAREAEEAGFEAAWFGDSQFLWRDVWATMALAAVETERIVLGAAVTNFETRHVAVTASAAATVAELAPGRVRVGVGTGDSAVKTLGRRPTRLARMREQIETLNRLLAAEAERFGDDEFFGERSMRVRHAPGHPLPIYMGASGPRALALAGEIADGAIVLAGLAPELIRRSLGRVESGAARGGRSRADVDIWLAAHAAVTPDEETAARLVKPLCLSSAQLGAAEALRAVGIDLEVPPVVEGIYPDVTHAENWERAIEVAERYVDDRAADRYARAFTLAGPAELIAGRVEAALEHGVQGFYVLDVSSYELPRALLRAFGERIIPRFAE